MAVDFDTLSEWWDFVVDFICRRVGQAAVPIYGSFLLIVAQIQLWKVSYEAILAIVRLQSGVPSNVIVSVGPKIKSVAGLIGAPDWAGRSWGMTSLGNGVEPIFQRASEKV